MTDSSAQARPPIFCRYGPSTDWMISMCMEEDQLPASLHLVIPLLISSRNALMHTPRNNVSPALCTSLSPVRLTHEIKTITSAEKPEKGGNQSMWAKKEEPVLILRHSLPHHHRGPWCNLFFSELVDAECLKNALLIWLKRVSYPQVVSVFTLLEGACTSLLLLKNPICCSTERKYVRCICG